MDDQEARKVVEAYWAGHSMTELYDQVIMPTLTIAERDRHQGALDSERQEFCFMSVRDILSECAGALAETPNGP